jgi:enoyl-CoA hydratase/carnithine racemase
VPDVLVARRGSTLVATLNRPEHANSVGGALFAELLAALEAGDADDDVRAIVTTGAGATYCVGGDRSHLEHALAEGSVDLGALGTHGMGGDIGTPVLSAAQRRADPIGIGRWVQRVLDVGTPTIAAINGGAAGGGLALALLHDIRIASSRARLAPNLVALGLAPEMGMTWLLPRLVGPSRAFDLVTRTTPIEADEALALGLVEQVVEPGELEDAALARAESFASLAPAAVRTAKWLLRQAAGSSLDDQLEREWQAQVRLFAAPETAATLRAFLGLSN